MNLLDPRFYGAEANPLDHLEALVAANEWKIERLGDDKIGFAVGGFHGQQYHLWFAWRADAGALELRCALEFGVPPGRYAEVADLLARLNSGLWIGHFDADPSEPCIVYRHTLLSASPDTLGSAALERLVEAALETCDRCVPAFMLMLWGGKRPADALAAAMLETAGEA